MNYTTVVLPLSYFICGLTFTYIASIITYDLDNEGSKQLGFAVFPMAIRAFSLSFLHTVSNPGVAWLLLLISDLSKTWIAAMTLMSLKYLVKDSSILAKPKIPKIIITSGIFINVLHLVSYLKGDTEIQRIGMVWVAHFVNTTAYYIYVLSHIYVSIYMILIMYAFYKNRMYIINTYGKKISNFLIKYIIIVFPFLILSVFSKHIHFVDRDLSSLDVFFLLIPVYCIFFIISKRNIDKLLSRSQVLDILDDLQEGIMTTNDEGKITYINKGFMNSFGKDDAIGENITQFLPIEWDKVKGESTLELFLDNKFLLCYYGDIKGASKSNQGKVLLLQDMTNLKFSQLKLEELNKSLETRVKNATRDLEESNSKLKDKIIESNRLATEMEKIANQDELTRLYNRRKIRTLIQEHIDLNPEKMHTMLYMDLNEFKAINDTMGHNIGDDILITFSNKLLETFINIAYIGRIGGDEFIVFIKDISDKEKISKYCQDFIEKLSDPVRIAEYDIQIKTSIGISILHKDAPNKETMLIHSDRAMYFAKREGNNKYKFYDELKGSQLL